MTTREIITIPDPILREASKPVEQIDERLNALIDDMFETMYEAPGIGLAAIQIALPRRLVVIDCGDPKDEEIRSEQIDKWEAESGGGGGGRCKCRRNARPAPRQQKTRWY